jgi:hypothetical protein
MTKVEFLTRRANRKKTPDEYKRDQRYAGWILHNQLYAFCKSINSEIDAAKPIRDEDSHWALNSL